MLNIAIPIAPRPGFHARWTNRSIDGIFNFSRTHHTRARAHTPAHARTHTYTRACSRAGDAQPTCRSIFPKIYRRTAPKTRASSRARALFPTVAARCLAGRRACVSRCVRVRPGGGGGGDRLSPTAFCARSDRAPPRIFFRSSATRARKMCNDDARLPDCGRRIAIPSRSGGPRRLAVSAQPMRHYWRVHMERSPRPSVPFHVEQLPYRPPLQHSRSSRCVFLWRKRKRQART